MATVQYGSMVVAIRGSIGGMTFAKNAGGNYVKSKGIPPRRQSLAQGRRVSILASWSSAWKDLTGGEKGAWHDFARQVENIRYNSLGIPYYLTSLQMFGAINGTRASVGLAMTKVPPADDLPVIPRLLALSANASVQPPVVLLSYDINSFPSDGYAMVEGYVLQRATLRKWFGPWRYVAVVASPPPDELDLSAAVEVELGPLVPGQTLFIRVAAVSGEGRKSAYKSITAKVV
jgi:hypothetical protein